MCDDDVLAGAMHAAGRDGLDGKGPAHERRIHAQRAGVKQGLHFTPGGWVGWARTARLTPTAMGVCGEARAVVARWVEGRRASGRGTVVGAGIAIHMED